MRELLERLSLGDFALVGGICHQNENQAIVKIPKIYIDFIKENMRKFKVKIKFTLSRNNKRNSLNIFLDVPDQQE